MPALLTSRCGTPQAATTSSVAVSIETRSVTSTSNARIASEERSTARAGRLRLDVEDRDLHAARGADRLRTRRRAGPCPPVTTATRPSRSKSESVTPTRPRLPPARRPARARRNRRSRRRRGRVRAAGRRDSSSSYGGRPPSRGRLDRDVAGRQHVPRGQRRAPPRASCPSSRAASRSVGSGRLTPSPSASGTRRRSRTSFRIPSGIERVGVVGALGSVAQREVLLDHARAEHVRDERHGDAVLVIREADDDVRVALAQRRDHGEVELVDRGGIGGGALQDAEPVVERPTASTARSTSSMVAPPVESTIGLPSAATCRSSGVLRRSPEAILNAGTSSSASRSALATSKAVAKNVRPSSRAYACSSTYRRAELERLAVLAVGGAEAVLVVVRRVERRAA